ncbi:MULTISPECIES: Yip1 family protein [Bacillus]|uniref:Yip1 domain-containing protein n=2 Tax=Bacillus cereus group TaxID=86661 RepID=A0A2B0WLZ1_BACAN|nr:MULTISPECIES: Yip1 family protein [Bacillus]MCU0094814.1 YIP1 family protein [Bacillus sp. OR9]KZD39518.1 putative Membrane Spanning Protein [Bacillus cereus]MBJ8060993.1 YIP1 family protein [Bacillus cereus]MBZ4226234.1 YIP1 family protein [Bacillus wiedmannii]MCU4758547.1 YIP1 family protein [Bacillus cereus]
MEANINTQDAVSKKPSLLGMITSPGEQFERMKNSNAVWGVFWILSLLSGITGGLGAYVYSLTPESIKFNQELGVNVTPVMTFGAGFVFGVIGMIIGFFISAAVYKVLMMLMSNDTSYKKLLTITVYSSIISLLGLLINAVLALILGGSGKEFYTGLGPIFASSGGAVKGIANSIEVFTIWGFVITWLGLQITAGLSKKKATILMVIFFILTIGFGALRGLVQ